MTDKMLKQIAESYGTPVFVYEGALIDKKYRQLADALPAQVEIFYSMKANPALAICQILKQCTKKIEVSSLGELYGARLAGFASEDILVSGPGKSQELLSRAIQGGELIQAESLGEIEAITQIAKRTNRQVSISIRLNPDFGLSNNGISMTGIRSQFGLELNDFIKAVDMTRDVAFIRLQGISVYTGTQILRAGSIVSITEEILKLGLSLQQRYGLKFEHIDFGGGFGIPYYGEEELDLQKLRVGLSTLFMTYKKELDGTRVYFESGRYLTAECGSFLTRILYMKESKGKKYLVCDGGFNAALIASFFSREIRGNFPIRLITGQERQTAVQKDIYTISGPLCSPRDILGINVRLPCAKEGDYICIGNVGAYGLTFSPVLFISQPIPPEVLVEDGNCYLIRERSSIDDILRHQVSVAKEGKS